MPSKSKEPMRRMVTVQPKFILFFLALLTLVFGIAFARQSAKVRKLGQQVEEAQMQVLAAYDKKEELERKLAFTATDEYVAQEARRRFGYMSEGEIRFVLEDAPAYETMPASVLAGAPVDIPPETEGQATGETPTGSPAE